MMRHVTMKFPAILLFLTLILRKAECSEDKRLLLHDAESVAAIIHQLETRVDELNSTHSKDMADLKDAHAKEVADLKAGLNAEKLERCRTGTINFNHAECATHQCSQSKVVVFSPPFSKVPVVTFAFSELDVLESHNLRINAGVSGVTTSSATLKVETWADTVVYGSALNWIACPDI